MRFLAYLFLLPLLSDTVAPVPPKPKPPPTPREVALRVLSGVQLSVGKAQAYVQPYVLLHLAENTVQLNRKLALIEFRDAFTDARIIDLTYRTPLEAQIVNAVAPVDITTAVDLIHTMRPEPEQRFARTNWDGSVQAINAQLLAHYRPDEAVELLKLVARPGVFPTNAASNLIASLPPDDRRLGVFGYAATCYRQFPFPGFTTLLQDHWRAMPPTLVVMAADAVADDGSHATTAELLQVLPILRAVDPPRAERLLNDHPEIQDPEKEKQKPGKPDYQQRSDERAIHSAEGVAQKYPMRALFLAENIHDPDAREQLVLQVADQTLQASGDSKVASFAIEILMKLPAKNQRDLPAELAELAAYAGRMDMAEQFVEAAFDLSGKLLEADLDGKSDCGVNPAPRDWWPSTAAYRAAMHAAVSVKHTAAESYLPRFQQDADLYLLMSIEFARALLGGATTVTPKLSCADAVAVAKEAAQS